MCPSNFNQKEIKIKERALDEGPEPLRHSSKTLQPTNVSHRCAHVKLESGRVLVRPCAQEDDSAKEAKDYATYANNQLQARVWIKRFLGY
jgi:hypothetical protein